MNTVEITNAMKKNNKTKSYFKGVYACDKLPRTKVKKPTCFIINTDPSSKPGTHWVAVYFPKKGSAEYFDSFGFRPKINSITNFINTNCTRFTYNKIQLQNIFSTVCGNYCCEYLLHRCQGKSRSLFFKNYSFKNTTQNDATTIKNFKLHFMDKRGFNRR
jgi:hypothetical protein